MPTYDVVVVGLGHAGIEAASAASRLGARVLALTLAEEAIGLLPCNPAMGGPAKGHLVREVDALGGAIGVLTDAARLQVRRLNTGKGRSVQATRAQVDKDLYPRLARSYVRALAGVTVAVGEVEDVVVRDGRLAGVKLVDGREVSAPRVVVTAGVYLRGSVVRGEERREEGPQGLPRASALSANLVRRGFRFRRFKTGTSPRVARGSVAVAGMREQPGDEGELWFSFLNEPSAVGAARPEGVPAPGRRPNVTTYLTHTTRATRDLILANLARAPLFNGEIQGVGPRYCPSVEDKVFRFAEKETHPVFLEPETLEGPSLYLGGLSTSLPRDVQEALLRTVPGLERAVILRYGYAIEYDALDPTELDPCLACKRLPGLYFAGSANGTSGYEEAAAQGLVAGANAVLSLTGRRLVLARHEAYTGVLVDDLVFKGTAEPYRMLTARAEYRLRLRQDNADLRLTRKAHELGLVDAGRWQAFVRREELVESLETVLRGVTVGVGGRAQRRLATLGHAALPAGTTVEEALRRTELTLADFRDVLPAAWPADVEGEVEARVKYGGYIAKEEARLARLRSLEGRRIPSDFRYEEVPGLSREAREKLARFRPADLGQASRIAGVRPGDVALLQLVLDRHAQG